MNEVDNLISLLPYNSHECTSVVCHGAGNLHICKYNWRVRYIWNEGDILRNSLTSNGCQFLCTPSDRRVDEKKTLTYTTFRKLGFFGFPKGYIDTNSKGIKEKKS